MKITLLSRIVCLLSFALLSIPESTKANHAAAGELTYQWVSGSTYKFIYKGYFDCSGTVAPTSVNVCATNKSTNISNYHVLTLWTGTIPPNGLPNCSVMPIGCYRQATQCDSPASTVKGYKECWFAADITLPDTSSNWQFTVSVNSRVAYDNIEQSNQYLFATLNNVKAQGNSSPYFNSKSVFYCCSRNQDIFQCDVIDPDGDSLVIDLIHPFSNPNSSNFCPTNPVLVTAKNFTPPITFPGNPFPVLFNAFFHLDTLGNIQFTPDTVGDYLLTYHIKEYRGGKLIGSVLRDVLFVSSKCKYYGISMVIDDTTIKNLQHFRPRSYIGCQLQPIEICVDIKASDTNAILYVSDTFKAATITYSQQGTDSIRACFKWTPQLSDSGSYSIFYSTIDSTCYLPGKVDRRLFAFEVTIRPKQKISISKYPLFVWEGLNVLFSSTTYVCNFPNFQWQVNGIDVPDATKPDWSTTSLKNGDIVSCIFKCDDTYCNDTTPVFSNTIPIQMATSVKGINEDSQIRLYPNPNDGNFTLLLYEAPSRDAQLEIINTYGQVVHRQSLHEQLQTVKLTPSIPGIYLLRVIDGEHIYTKRITVQ